MAPTIKELENLKISGEDIDLNRSLITFDPNKFQITIRGLSYGTGMIISDGTERGQLLEDAKKIDYVVVSKRGEKGKVTAGRILVKSLDWIPCSIHDWDTLTEERLNELNVKNQKTLTVP